MESYVLRRVLGGGDLRRGLRRLVCGFCRLVRGLHRVRRWFRLLRRGIALGRLGRRLHGGSLVPGGRGILVARIRHGRDRSLGPGIHR